MGNRPEFSVDGVKPLADSEPHFYLLQSMGTRAGTPMSIVAAIRLTPTASVAAVVGFAAVAVIARAAAAATQ
jgi:hypothetical protein